ncbi:MAG: AIR synthase-related protein [Patescibacteria group bacterium]
MKDNSQYGNLGVSSDKKGVHKAIRTLDKGLFEGAFCRIFPDNLTGDVDYCLIAHADGVGTKASLGYLYWKVTGDISALANLAIDAIVMNLDDMICVGATGPFTFTQNIDRNSFTIPDEIIEAIIVKTNEVFIDLKKRHGIDITYSGGETADVNDLVRTLTLNASMQARMRRKDVIRTNILPGDVIVGLASFGKARYEQEYNSGIGSNGLTLARHSVFHPSYRELYPESYEEALGDKAYRGQYYVDGKLSIKPRATVGKLVLSPTRTYAPIVKAILSTVPRESIHAMIHCSGGGQTKCMGFGKKVHIVKDTLFPVPPVFSIIQDQSNETWQNMYKTFNMGHRFELYCDESTAAKIVAISKSFGVDAQIIGRVHSAANTCLTIRSVHGEFFYKK